MALMPSSALVRLVVGQFCVAYPILPWQAGLFCVGFAAFCSEADSARCLKHYFLHNTCSARGGVPP